MLRRIVPAVVLVVAAVTSAHGQQKVMLKATADVGVTSVRGHFLDSLDVAPSTAIRQNQNWAGFETKALLMNFDVAPVRGWNIKEAYLHLYVAKEDLYGVGVCEVLAPWGESEVVNGKQLGNGACWQYARLAKEPKKPAAGDLWAWPGSNLPSVSWSHPIARYSYAGPNQIRKEPVGYPGESPDFRPFVHLTIPVDPVLVASLAAGTNYGLVLTDDKGQVAESYSLIGPGYPYLYNEAADPYVFTRDIQDESLRPVLEVIGGPADEATPEAPKDLKVVKVEPSTSTVTLEMVAPAGKTMAYEVMYGPGGSATGKAAPDKPLPRWEIPLPAKAGTKQLMPVWTLAPGEYTLGVRTVSKVGYRSQMATVKVTVPAVPEVRLARATDPSASPQAAGPANLEIGQGRVYAVPDIVKVDPVTGALLSAGDVYRLDESYQVQNPVWSGSSIWLQSAANETVAFQLIIEKGQQPLRNVRVSLNDLAGDAGKITATPNLQAFRVWYLKSKKEEKRQLGPNEVEDVTIRPVAWHGDAGVPLAKPFEQIINIPAEDNGIEGQTNQAIWVDIYVPKGTASGTYRGQVSVTAEGIDSPANLPVTVRVLPLTLPDKPTWIVELNSYGNLTSLAGVNGRDPEALDAQWDFYRLAKQHRQMINVLPYKQSGRVDLPAPKLEGDGREIKVVDWAAFDAYYGPLLDGSAFSADRGYVGPGAGTGISEMYLPFHENWPLPLEKWYQDYARMKTRLDFAAWAKKSRLLNDAFPEDYKLGYASVARQFAEHLQQKGWTQTVYQGFLNNKYYFKVPYFASQMTESKSTGTSFWLLDEPVDYDDYMANAFFLGLVQQGWKQAQAPDVKFAMRTDVSQPEMTRNLWNGVCDLWVCGGSAIRTGYVTTAVVRQKWLAGEEFWHYGGGPSLSAASANILQVFLDSWASGSSGILPYWTTEGGTNWTKPKDADLAIYYTGRNYANSGKNYPGPLAGLRMKVMRRAQQDIEYLHLLAGQKGWDRSRVRLAIASYADNPAAPVLLFDKLGAQRQYELRQAVAATIVEASPQAQR